MRQIEDMRRSVEAFVGRLDQVMTIWRERIDEHGGDGPRVVVWGASSKTVSFLAALGLRQVTVVDINPLKQEMWLPGVAVQVEAPSVLPDRCPSLVIPMNPIYLEEIATDLGEMGLSPRLIAA